MKSSEGRSKVRVSTEKEVRIRCEDWDQFKTEHSENISEGGVFIKTHEPLRPGTLFRLSIDVGTEEITGQARVIWTKEFSAEEGRTSGMGARFVELSDASKKRLHEFISSLAE